MQIKEICFENFDDFIKSLVLPSGDLFNKLNGFIFRGVSSGKYELIPSALREQNREKLWKSIECDEIMKELEYWQIQAEYSLIREFYRLANQKGLKIPKVQVISNNFATLMPFELFIRENDYLWVGEEFEELVAFAQHYGLPTRMLDWTFDINVAMYFASIGSIKEYSMEKEGNIEKDVMVIWALNAQYFQSRHPYPLNMAPLSLVVPSYSDNPNLRAQKGILSQWRIVVPGHGSDTTEMLTKKVDRTPLDQLITKFYEREKFDETVALYKLTIPKGECIDMYNYIQKMGYGAASLFPGYDGVVKEISESKMCRDVGRHHNENKV